VDGRGVRIGTLAASIAEQLQLATTPIADEIFQSASAAIKSGRNNSIATRLIDQSASAIRSGEGSDLRDLLIQLEYAK